MIALREKPRPAPASATSGGSASAGSGSSPSPSTGRLLIADRGNNRLLVVDARKRVLWRYPGLASQQPKGGFYFPDDAFFIHGGRGNHLQRGGERGDRRARLPIGQGASLIRASGSDRLRAPATSTSPTTPTCSGTARSPSPTRRTAGSSSWVPVSAARRSAPRGAACHDPPRQPRLAQRRHPAGERRRPGVRGQRLICRRAHARGSPRLEHAPADRVPVRPAAAGPGPLPGRRLRPPGGVYEFNRAGRILWSYHPASGRRNARPPEPCRALPGRLDRGHRRLPRSGRADRPARPSASSGSTATPTCRAPGPIG